MIRGPSVLSAYLFVRKNRFRKKRKLYKMALGVMVDKTTAIYLILLGGYAIASFFIFGDFINQYHHEILVVEEQAIKRFWLVAAVLPLRFVTQSFRNPGVVFSSSEFQLGMLSYSRQNIWLLSVLEKLAKKVFLYSVLGLFIALITPISSLLVLAYIVLLLAMDMLMTIPQWKLFQTKFKLKIIWLVIYSMLNFIGIITGSSKMIGVMVITSIIIINLTLFRTLFQNINWGKVMEISDYTVWTMPLIERASMEKFKRQKKYGIFTNSAARKKPFQYTETAIHHRLWQIYFGKNVELILQLIGTLVVMIVVLRFINHEWIIYIGIVIMIYVYSTVAATFFRDRFQSDLIEVLPWELHTYKKTFSRWVYIGGIPIAVPVLFHFILNMTIWAPIQLIFLYYTFLFMFDIKISKAISLLERKSESFGTEESLASIFLIATIISGWYPALSLCFIMVLWIATRWKANKSPMESRT